MNTLYSRNAARIMRAILKHDDLAFDHLYLKVAKPLSLPISERDLSNMLYEGHAIAPELWKSFCNEFRVDPASIHKGTLDYGPTEVSIKQCSKIGAFHIPDRYSYLQAEAVRCLVPFIAAIYHKLGLVVGDHYVFKVMRSLGMDPDYLYILNHPINTNLAYDLIERMVSDKIISSIKDILEMVPVINRPDLGNLEGVNAKDLTLGILTLIDTFEINTQWEHEHMDGPEDTNLIQIDIWEKQHIREYKTSKEVEHMVELYRMQYMEYLCKLTPDQAEFEYALLTRGTSVKMRIKKAS